MRGVIGKSQGKGDKESWGVQGLLYVGGLGKASPIRWHLKECLPSFYLGKNVPGGGKSKCKGPEVGVFLAV